MYITVMRSIYSCANYLFPRVKFSPFLDKTFSTTYFSTVFCILNLFTAWKYAGVSTGKSFTEKSLCDDRGKCSCWRHWWWEDVTWVYGLEMNPLQRNARTVSHFIYWDLSHKHVIIVAAYFRASHNHMFARYFLPVHLEEFFSVFVKMEKSHINFPL